MRTRTVGMANVVVLLMFLVGVGAAQAETVIFEGLNATEILDLQVGATVYDVIFLDDTASNIYGTVPLFDFTTSEGAEAAMEAVNAALNREPDVMSVGPAFDIVYEVPFEFLGEILGIDFVNAREAVYVETPSTNLGTPAWLQRTDPQARPFKVRKTYAVFTVVPQPGTAVLIGLGLGGLAVAGRSRQKQNHGGNDWQDRPAQAGGTG